MKTSSGRSKRMSNPGILIAVVGLPGSGKSVASDFFRTQGFTVLRFGDQTDIGLKESGLPVNETNERAYRESIRKELGMAAMAIKIEPRIRKAAETSDKIVLDGMKGFAEYLHLKDIFPHLRVLCIYAPPDVRYRRLAMRKVRPLTAEEAHNRDIAELTALDTGGSMAIADYLIRNLGSEEEFRNKLTEYLGSLI